MEACRLLKELTLGRGTEFIKVRISREWEGRKAGATYATTKTYIIIDEEVCFIPYYILYHYGQRGLFYSLLYMYVFVVPIYMEN